MGTTKKPSHQGRAAATGGSAAPRSALQQQQAQRYRACRGGAPRSESKTNDCRWQLHIHLSATMPPTAFRKQPVGLNGITQCSGDDSSPCNVPNTTCLVEQNHPRYVIPSEQSESRNPPKQQVLPYVGYFCNLSGFLHSADAAVGMT